MRHAWFKFTIWLGRRGLFVYSGMRGCHPHWWPEARVRYPEYDGSMVSAPMAVGNAVQYAEMFGGTVEPVNPL